MLAAWSPLAAHPGLTIEADRAAGTELAAVAAEAKRLGAELEALHGVQLAQAQPGQLGRFEVRLGQLEEELRRLTGRIEQLEFGQRSLERRFDQLIGDLDQRLRALEPGGGEPARRKTAEPQPPAPRPSAEVAPRTTASPQVAPAPAGQGQGEDQSLGRIPESALQGLPRPEPGEIAPPPKTSKLTAKQQYDDAMELLRAGDYAGAERGLKLFLDVNPNDPLAANAAYWLAETYYVRKNFAAAAAAFARNYRTYGKTAAKAPDNLLKLGMSLRGLGEADKACLSYDELAKEFPNAPAHIHQALARERARAQCG